MVARKAHNLEVTSSNLVPATRKYKPRWIAWASVFSWIQCAVEARLAALASRRSRGKPRAKPQPAPEAVTKIILELTIIN